MVSTTSRVRSKVVLWHSCVGTCEEFDVTVFVQENGSEC